MKGITSFEVRAPLQTENFWKLRCKNMAKRRCISVDVYESEEYFELSDKAKVLYTHFILRSDDEGVIINPKTAMRLCGAGEEILRELIDSGFVLRVEEIYVIRHWYAHNQIQPTKKTNSLYREELSAVIVNDKKIYEFDGADKFELVRPNISKDNISKYNVIKNNTIEPKSVEEKQRLTLPIPSLGRKAVDIE